MDNNFGTNGSREEMSAKATLLAQEGRHNEASLIIFQLLKIYPEIVFNRNKSKEENEKPSRMERSG